MSAFIAFSYIIGMIVTSVVLRRRAGVKHFGRISILDMGVVWFAKAMVIMFFWPIALVVSLIRRAGAHQRNETSA